jgi:hypothetical protein
MGNPSAFVDRIAIIFCIGVFFGIQEGFANGDINEKNINQKGDSSKSN